MATIDAVKAAEKLGIPPRRLKSWRNSGLGPSFIRLSHKTVVYDSDVLDAFLRARTRQPSVQAFMEERHVRKN